jgi:AraC-like DNA-binding protein
MPTRSPHAALDDRPEGLRIGADRPPAGGHEIAVRGREDFRWELHRYGPGPAGSHPRHAHETYQIGYSPDFDGEYWYRGEHVPVSQGHLHVLHPGEVHAPRDPRARPRPVRFPTAFVDPALVQRATRDLGAPTPSRPFFPPVIADPALTALFLSLVASAGAPDDALRRTSLERTFLARLVERHGGGGPADLGSEHDAVQAVRDYVHAHFRQSLTLEELGEVAGLNPYYLSRVFREEVGLPPYRYVTQLRVQAAARRLAQGDAIAAVAFDTGFADQPHLTRHFKRIVGVPPGRYRPN